ncbi:hypothetical protein ACLKA6_005205 [Drosophila palustris]
MSKAFLKHANCLYVTRNSKRNRRKDEDDDGDEVEVEDEADDEDEDEAAHPKHKHKEQNEMTMSSQPLSHESENREDLDETGAEQTQKAAAINLIAQIICLHRDLSLSLSLSRCLGWDSSPGTWAISIVQ